MTTLTARRQARKFSPRATAFLEPTARERREPLGLLARAPDGADRVYLLGDRLAARDGLAAWLERLPDGWREHPRGSYLEGEHPVMRLVRPDGRPLELLRAASWYGEGDYSASLAARAWELLEVALRDAFGADAALLSSPAATGRDLFRRSIPFGREWDTLPDELQSLIRATTGQGRIELLPRSGELGELVGYDGRMMYAALCRELPHGSARHVRAREYLGYTRARYNATAQVPRDWAERCACGAPGHGGLGLLGWWDYDARGWEYPSEPGRVFSGWWDGAEIHVALAHGWRFEYHTAIVWERSDQRQGPLDGWARRLIGARNALLEVYGQGDGRAAAVLAGRAVRAIVLHAIGAFFAGARRVTQSAPLEHAAERVPADAADLRVEGDSIVWAATVPPAWPELCHPEWPAAIWARARARLLDGPDGQGGRAGALHVPASSLVAFRTDAIYLDADPGWGDDGRPGRLRRTLKRAGPLPAPQNADELLEATR